MSITPLERLRNLELAALLEGPYEEGSQTVRSEWVLLPDSGRLVVRAFPTCTFLYEHWQVHPPGHHTRSFIDEPTAAGLMAWKWSTPLEV